MAADAEALARRVERFVEQCREADIRVTHQRIEIFREVVRTSEHPDAEMICKRVRRRIPTVSLDTVYRTLRFFVDKGFVATMGIHHDRLRFDGNLEKHHHMVCVQCGRVSDFTSKAFENLDPPDEIRDWGDIHAAHVELRGVCAKCKKA